jgi:hypothetical protein
MPARPLIDFVNSAIGRACNIGFTSCLTTDPPGTAAACRAMSAQIRRIIPNFRCNIEYHGYGCPERGTAGNAWCRVTEQRTQRGPTMLWQDPDADLPRQQSRRESSARAAREIHDIGRGRPDLFSAVQSCWRTQKNAAFHYSDWLGSHGRDGCRPAKPDATSLTSMAEQGFALALAAAKPKLGPGLIAYGQGLAARPEGSGGAR